MYMKRKVLSGFMKDRMYELIMNMDEPNKWRINNSEQADIDGTRD